MQDPNALSHELCVAMRCVLCSGLVSRRHVLRGDALPDRQLLGEAPDAATAALHTHTHTRARAHAHTHRPSRTAEPTARLVRLEQSVLDEIQSVDKLRETDRFRRRLAPPPPLDAALPRAQRATMRRGG